METSERGSQHVPSEPVTTSEQSRERKCPDCQEVGTLRPMKEGNGEFCTACDYRVVTQGQ